MLTLLWELLLRCILKDAIIYSYVCVYIYIHLLLNVAADKTISKVQWIYNRIDCCILILPPSNPTDQFVYLSE